MSHTMCSVHLSGRGWGVISSLAHTPPVFSPQAASLPMSIIIVGVGPAEFDGKCVHVHESVCMRETLRYMYRSGQLRLLYI